MCKSVSMETPSRGQSTDGVTFSCQDEDCGNEWTVPRLNPDSSTVPWPDFCPECGGTHIVLTTRVNADAASMQYKPPVSIGFEEDS